MARTPIVDLLRRAAIIAAHAKQSGRPLDEVIEIEREARVDRARRDGEHAEPLGPPPVRDGA